MGLPWRTGTAKNPVSTTTPETTVTLDDVTVMSLSDELASRNIASMRTTVGKFA